MSLFPKMTSDSAPCDGCRALTPNSPPILERFACCSFVFLLGLAFEAVGGCPRQQESAGKRLSTRTFPGNPWLKTTLVQVAWVAARTRNTYLRAQFLRLKSRRGPKKAILAVAASILTAAYYILKDDVTYREPGADYFERRDRAHIARRLIQRLARLGLSVGSGLRRDIDPFLSRSSSGTSAERFARSQPVSSSGRNSRCRRCSRPEACARSDGSGCSAPRA